MLFFGLCGWSLPYRLAILVSFRVLRTMFIPAALHGIEASGLSQGGFFFGLGLLLFELVGLVG